MRTAPHAVVAEVRRGTGSWEPVSAAQLDAQVVAVAKGLVAMGIEPGDLVGIMARTRYEWTLLDFAIWVAGAVSVPLYETSSSEQVEWILSDSAVRLLVVETAAHAATVVAARDNASALRDVLVIDDGAIERLEGVGADVTDEEIARRRRIAGLDDVATIIYTSGTTGRPKGVVLTHGNFASLAANTVAAMPEVFTDGGRTLLFLPLAHVFARFIEVIAIAGGIVLGHTSDVKTLSEDFASFRPTFVLAVPRVFEKVCNSAEQKAAARGRRRVFQWATRVGVTWSRALDTARGPSPWLRAQHRIASVLVFSKLRAALGGQAKYAVSGGSPLGERLGHYFRAVGLVVLEGYGLTESTAPATVNRPAGVRIGTVGMPLPGCDIRIAEDGEIQLRGPHVFREYHNAPEATAEAFDGEWFRTGDLGSLDAEGYLTITGRQKEIIITAAGKNVAPAVLEDRVRAHALVSQCVVVGDNRPFIGAMIILDPEGVPGWLAMHGKADLTLEEARKDPDLIDALRAAIRRANAAVSTAESVRRFGVLPGDLTEENGYLTPKQSVRRGVFVKDFAAQIDDLYDKGAPDAHDVMTMPRP
ncbi:AMP-dependent synthetase/ligase [Jiangella muralis]|uniref:AMP-dependent synthetase/ligase n=1 Tax=Jiangella muralis TaxID=702383 RepID=UPI001F0B086B|nr:AMP-dependent synthetase/ligase [Jiangella muralis]